MNVNSKNRSPIVPPIAPSLLETEVKIDLNLSETTDILETEELMSQTIKPLSPDAVVAVTGSTSSETNDALQALMLRRLLKEDAEEEKRKREFEAGREANIRDVKLRHENQRRLREACSHRNEHNRTNVRGQRDHDQNTIWLCQSCQNMWKDFARPEDALKPGNRDYLPLPNALRPNTEIIWVGGPVAS